MEDRIKRLEEKCAALEDALGTLISWLVLELGVANAEALLAKLNNE